MKNKHTDPKVSRVKGISISCLKVSFMFGHPIDSCMLTVPWTVAR